MTKRILNWRRRLLTPLALLLDSFARLTSRPKRHKQPCLFLIRVDAIGDFILWLDAAKEYRNLYPDYHITLVGNKIWTDLARSMPFWDEVMPLDRRRFREDLLYRWRFICKLLAFGCDIAVQPTYSRELTFGDALFRVLNVQICIGSAGDPSRPAWEKLISNRWYNKLLSTDPNPLMELERNAEFIRNLGAKNFQARLPRLPLEIESSPNPVRRLGKYFVLFPGAKWSGRRWPLARFSQLAKQIYQRYGWKGVICGGPEDTALGEELIQQDGSFLENWTGRTTLVEFIAIAKGAQVVITNETSAVHIAAAVRTPSVCIVGGGHFGRFLPYMLPDMKGRPLPLAVFQHMDCFGCNWLCRYAIKDGQPAPCIEEISVDAVWQIFDNAVHGKNDEYWT